MLALFGWNFDCLQERVSGSRYTRDRNLGETGMLEVARVGHGVRPGHQTQDEISAAVVMNSHIRRIEGGSAEPDEDLLDGSLSPLTSVGLKEIHRLARLLPVIVLVPRYRAVDQAVTRKMPVAQ